ncbi:MAG TPA: inositol 2-dehydrogenase [Trueperaceae bacterium]|nr:inositol 2-dehydrogenase [Trueperaceae bacterium]
MTGDIGFAVVGAGRIGALHARHLAGSVDGARLVMVVDADEATALRVAGGRPGVSIGTDIAEALDARDVHAVLIASPTSLHSQQLLAAAAAGKAIFCEKPVANDLQETIRAMVAVTAAGVPFQIGFNRRFDPAYAAVGTAVRTGKIGAVELFRSQSSDPGPAPEAYIASSAGFFKDSVIHDIDTARFVAGEVERVTALGRVMVDPVYERYGDVDTSVISIEFVSGALGVLMNSRRTVYGHDLRLEVHGSLGKVVAEDERATKVWNYDAGGVHGDFYYHFIERFTAAYRLELQAFVTAVKAGEPPTPGATDAIESLRVAEAAEMSLKHGRSVALSELRTEVTA